MASKTFDIHLTLTMWLEKADNLLCCRGLLTGGVKQRVCVRIDPAPKQMTRAELAKVINPGWFVIDDLGEHVVVGVNERGTDCGHGGNLWCAITAARPHSEAEWINVTD